MSNFHDTFLDNLPPGWSFDRLKDIVSLRNEKTDKASEEQDYLELEDLESGSGRILNLRNTLEVGSAVTLFKKNDVLFGKLRPYLEKYWQAEFDGKCTGEILAFEPQRISSRFLFYCIGSRWFIERCNALAYGAKMPRVSWPTQLSQFNIPLPPLPEQKRIAAYLDASCAAIDAAVAAKRRQIETLAMLLHATLTQILKRGLKKEVVMKPSGEAWLGHIPLHWSMKRIKDIAQLKSGEGISAEEITAADQFPVYGGNGLRGYTSSFTHDGYFPLIGRQGALCGNINYASGKFWATEHAVVVTALRQCDVIWLGELLRIMNLNQYSNATAQPGLSVDRIKYLRLPVPPVEEQVAIARHIREANEKFTNLNSNLDEQVKTLTAYRKSLIHECVTGQRRITDEGVKRAEAQWPGARGFHKRSVDWSKDVEEGGCRS